VSLALSPDHCKIVQDVLTAHLPPGFAVRVFGSHAKGTTKPFSDLDLALKGREALTLSQLADLTEAFSESDLPFKVDIVDWRSVSSTFQAIIDRDGVALDPAPPLS
jgi:predicted nucleotidyltransferase